MSAVQPLGATLSVKEAAAIAGISRRHAYNLIRRGDLPSVRFGGAIRVPAHRLVALLDGGGQQDAAEA